MPYGKKAKVEFVNKLIKIVCLFVL